MEAGIVVQPPRSDIAVYLLAGGASTRMGRSKARLEIDGEPMVRHLARALVPHVAQVLLVAKPDQGLEDLGLPMLYDATPDRALVHGLRAVLAATGPKWRFVCACDMPEVGAAILGRLWRDATQAGAPGSCLRHPESDAPEPLPSLWRADVALLESARWGLAARAWIRGAGLVAGVATTAECAALVNVNTPDDWCVYRRDRQRGGA